ncbi:acyl-CoA dehydrogenase family protein [Streptomyces sp. NPDC048106]|uniref:acyl-CoA dehydrogenase family protein n=1 Tax=Streptomyces sp. NPDC048106 TaxID=3155750 RepID=UPI0034557E0A
MPFTETIARVDSREALAERYAPLYRILEAEAAAADTAGELPDRVLDALRSSGILGAAVPREYGGQGGDAVLTNRLIEQVAGLDPSVSIILFQHFAVCARITEWGTSAQREYYLPRLADGSWLAASAWSESGAGADKRNIATKAVRAGNGWILDGAKAFTTGAGLAQVYLILAQSAAPGGGDLVYGSDGQSFYLVEADTPGLVADTSLDLVGMRASATGFVELRSCQVPDSALLGPAGKAATIIAGVRGSGATLGAVAVGIADAVYRMALAKARKQGLTDNQLTRDRLSDLSARVEGVRAVVEAAGRREGPNPGLTTLRSKVMASTLAEEICLQVQRYLGSAGFVAGHPVNRLARDVRAVCLMGPTNDLCRQLISAEQPS